MSELSEEAKQVLTFCRQSSTIMVHKITAGVSIFLGNLEKGKEKGLYNKEWLMYPRMLCSKECFEEICQAGHLIHIMERWQTHKEEAYVVK
jgi:hypothetical protein